MCSVWAPLKSSIIHVQSADILCTWRTVCSCCSVCRCCKCDAKQFFRQSWREKNEMDLVAFGTKSGLPVLPVTSLAEIGRCGSRGRDAPSPIPTVHCRQSMAFSHVVGCSETATQTHNVCTAGRVWLSGTLWWCHFRYANLWVPDPAPPFPPLKSVLAPFVARKTHQPVLSAKQSDPLRFWKPGGAWWWVI